jgi:hypothetical protein
MAKLNANSMLCNVAVNDHVVAGRMGIGSQRAGLQTAALLSQGWPAPAGPAPTAMMRPTCALVADDYCAASRERTGRSAVSPNAGGLELPWSRPDHTRTAIAQRWQLAKQPAKAGPFAASATRQSSGR